jgi:hypothetical protein
MKMTMNLMTHTEPGSKIRGAVHAGGKVRQEKKQRKEEFYVSCEIEKVTAGKVKVEIWSE